MKRSEERKKDYSLSLKLTKIVNFEKHQEGKKQNSDPWWRYGAILSCVYRESCYAYRDVNLVNTIMLTKEEVQKIAALARIRFTEAELEALRGEFESILGFVGKLSELDTQKVLPTAQVGGLVNSVRSDESSDAGIAVDVGELLTLAPKSESGYIKTKAVFE